MSGVPVYSRLALVSSLIGGLASSAGCQSRSASSPPESVPTASATPRPSVEATTSPAAEDPKPATESAAVATPSAPPVVDEGPLAPLPPKVREQLSAIRPDPPPAHLVRDTHYWISNEQSHFLWHDAVRGRGGAFLGVATDQNYLLAGWARPELLILMDFDAGVVDLHRVYGVLFDRAGAPADLRELWSASSQEQVLKWLHGDLAPEHVESAVAAYRSAREIVESRLRAVDEQYRERGVPTFLSDPEQFEHLQTLWRNGRVVAVRGDLTADQTMADIAVALRAAGLELSVLYLSNAEQYFRYRASFRRNIAQMPMAEDGVVLRTHGWIQFGYVKGEDYHYNTQSAPLFAEWMARGRAWGVPAMLEHRSKTKVRGYSMLDRPPPRRGGGKSSPSKGS